MCYFPYSAFWSTGQWGRSHTQSPILPPPPKPGVGNLLNLWATFSPNKVPAGCHSSGPKEKSLRQKFRPFFGRIDGEDQQKVFAKNSGPFSAKLKAKIKKEKDKLMAKTTKKDFCHEMKIISAVYCCISIIEKRLRAG